MVEQLGKGTEKGLLTREVEAVKNINKDKTTRNNKGQSSGPDTMLEILN